MGEGLIVLNISQPPLSAVSVASPDVTNIEQLRRLQQQRLASGLASLNEAKKNLEEAIARTETREREFREVSDDVQRKLAAIDLVATMAKELAGTGENQPRLPAPAGPNPIGSLAAPEKPEASADPELTAPMPVRRACPRDASGAFTGRSSRPLFSAPQRSVISRYSILK